MKRNTGIAKLKAKDSFNRIEIAEALWEYVCLNGSLYGAETTVFTEQTIKKLETLQNQYASWLLNADNGTATEALRELGWDTIRTTISKRKLNYVNRIRDRMLECSLNMPFS